MEIKQCTRCEKNKILSSFHKYGNICKICTAIKNKNYYENNKKAISKRIRNYHENNRSKYLLKAAKNRAKSQNLQFDIDYNYIESIIPKNNTCPLLNIKMKINNGYAKDNSYSIDRIDPNKGYIIGNIHIISYKANTSKSNSTIEEYERIVGNLENIILNGVKCDNKNNYKLNSLIYSAKERSKKYNIAFDINKEYISAIFPENNKCLLLEIDLKNNKHKPSFCSITLDRVIPEKGYVKGNVIIVSHKANTIKNNLTLKEMKLLLLNWKTK